MSFGCSPTDILKLVEFSTRVYLAFKDANENSEAQVQGLVREFSAFHDCLSELAELMKKYGRPMPFPCKEFELTLERCDKALEPYAQHLIDKKMGIKKIIYVIRYMGMEKEIDGLRKQIAGHYQALNMCISFLQLRLHLEATKQTQRLLDVATPQVISVRGRAYSTQALASSSLNPPLAIEAPDEHPLYQEWKVFNRWLQSEDDRVAQRVDTSQPLSSDDVSMAGSSSDAERAFALYQLRQQVDDLISLEENHTKRAAAERRTHLVPSDAMKQGVRETLDSTQPGPRLLQRTCTIDTATAFEFPDFSNNRMSTSSATLRPRSKTPSPMTSPVGSPHIESSYLQSTNGPQSPTDSVMDRDISRQPSVSTNRSSFNGSLDSRLSDNGLCISTPSTTPEDLTLRNLQRRPSATSLITIKLGEGALDWKPLAHKVEVQKTRQERIHGQDKTIHESKTCDIHWQYRRDTGISLRAVYRSQRDGKSRPWATQHFPAIGPFIPLTTTFPDGGVTVDFPRGSFGRLEKHLTDIKYTFPDFEEAEKFQTLLYTNDGAEPAELVFDRCVITVSSNKNSPECRARNLRLWLRSETHVDENGPVIYHVLILLFYTSALGEKGHWVEEPHYAFEWLTKKECAKSSDELVLQFSKEPAKWIPHKLLARTKSSQDTTIEPPPRSASVFSRNRKSSIEVPELKRSGTGGSISSAVSIQSTKTYFGQSSGASKSIGLNRYGYSELTITFRNKEDRKDFVNIWQKYVKPVTSGSS